MPKREILERQIDEYREKVESSLPTTFEGINGINFHIYTAVSSYIESETPKLADVDADAKKIADAILQGLILAIPSKATLITIILLAKQKNMKKELEALLAELRMLNTRMEGDGLEETEFQNIGSLEQRIADLRKELKEKN